jgi:hypothetical protein
MTQASGTSATESQPSGRGCNVPAVVRFEREAIGNLAVKERSSRFARGRRMGLETFVADRRRCVTR